MSLEGYWTLRLKVKGEHGPAKICENVVDKECKSIWLRREDLFC